MIVRSERSREETIPPGNLRIVCDEILNLPVSASDPTNPAEYQIAAKVRELCKARGIAPDEFVVGSTGIGRGVGAVLQREWSPRIQIVDENGAPSEMIVSQENPRPAKEIYDRKVTELWFGVREFVEADMIRGLDRQTANQLCSRTYEDKGSGGGEKIRYRRRTRCFTVRMRLMLWHFISFYSGKKVSTP
jgi:hypothetical protein